VVHKQQEQSTMKTFHDTAGREWAVTVDLPAISRVMKSGIEYMGEPIKVNLLSLLEPNSDLLKKSLDYPPMIGGIVYALCQPQCVERNVSDDDFARALDGDVLGNALDCILEETIGFFPQDRRKVLSKVLEKSQTFAQKMKALTEARLATGELDAAIDAMLNAELEKLQAHLTAGTGTAGSSSALPRSTPPAEASQS
jgi:hypothetical protein